MNRRCFLSSSATATVSALSGVSSAPSAVELRTGHKHGVESSIDAAARGQVKGRFASSNVRLLSFGNTREFESPDEAVRRQNIQTGNTLVDLAKDTGAVPVKVRPNGLPAGVVSKQPERFMPYCRALREQLNS